ncbi:MAG: tRNA (guanine(46)-N(7))-methyltransferase TrmB [Planctomycetes bacterium]|nr:tRNA (guanine(46)-N(7))-methyltransferase TrmB [Planctomycetota bacterium]
MSEWRMSSATSAIHRGRSTVRWSRGTTALASAATVCAPRGHSRSLPKRATARTGRLPSARCASKSAPTESSRALRSPRHSSVCAACGSLPAQLHAMRKMRPLPSDAMDPARGKRLDIGHFGLRDADMPPHEAGAWDPRALFACPSNPLEIEIGSGKGTFLCQQAAVQPESNFLGIEWTADFWRSTADRLRRNQLEHVRILLTDAGDLFRHRLADCIARVVHIYFSDPWPKGRHHKRRVVQTDTLLHFHRVLSPGGELRLVTDHPALWQWYERHAEMHASLFERRPFLSPTSARPGEVVGTNYERKFIREGRTFNAMTLVRREVQPTPRLQSSPPTWKSFSRHPDPHPT